MQQLILRPLFWTIPLAVWTLVVAASLVWNWSELDRHSREIAADRARFVFKMVESVRLWNARHGGVYVLVDEHTRPNEYLEIEERDIATPSGRPLTLMNPAFMTRELTYVVMELSGIGVHLTSLKPINPNNVADSWETRALQAFERGSEEEREFVKEGGATLYRYMAPLVTTKACLTCHEKQGYKVGDIRGGVSVAFEADPLLAPQLEQKWIMAQIHLGVWLLVGGLVLFGLHRSRVQLLRLKNAKEQQDRMVELRTAELRDQVRERKHAEDELRRLIDSSGEGIFGLDMEGRFTFCNPVGLRLLGYSTPEELIGRPAHGLIHHSWPDGSPRGEDACELVGTLRAGRAVHSDADIFWRADGGAFRVEYRSHPIMRQEEIVGAVVNFADITERKELENRIWHQAHYDLLTGLPNRNLFYDRLNQMLLTARRSGERFAVLYVDLDHFKEVNDTYGHEVGDALLQEASRRLIGCVRSSDTVARMGGDEFNIILAGVSETAAAERVAGKILAEMARAFAVAGSNQHVSASVGIACYPFDGAEAEELLKHADQAMYRAKQDGRNAFRAYSSNRCLAVQE